MKKNLKVLLLFNSPTAKPRGYDFKEEMADPDNMYTEKNVYDALLANGYEVKVLGIYDDVSLLFEEVRESRPDVIFNMVEMFNNRSHLEKNTACLFEMMDIPYTGASPTSLMICNDKGLSKKILSFHRVKVPNFYIFYKNERVWLSKRLKLPAIIKPLCEEASRGISQASIVDNEDSFLERIGFIHEKMDMDAIAEEYIDGRELYGTVMGNQEVIVFPFREMKFGQLPEGEPRIATYKAKWDDAYRDRWGIKSVFAGKLAEGIDKKIEGVCRRAYRALNMRSYARFDIRLTAEGQVYVLEPNANPCLARCDEMAQSAEKTGIEYPDLIRRIVELAFER